MEIRLDLDATWNIHRIVVVMSTVNQLTRTNNWAVQIRVQCSSGQYSVAQAYAVGVKFSRNLEAINYKYRQTDVL